ncbi:MAG: toprim domain-containing protein, partial [Actinomycetota bacterium]|nr:toprim domain-containing protein [Actinomycetota bacterium]
AVRYVEACRRILWTPAGKPVREWLVHERQIPEDVLRTNQVGADPGPRVLPRPRGLPRHGIGAVLPALAPDGTITYFQLRYLEPPPGRDRYDNPANRLGTNPRLGWVQPASRYAPDRLVVCEGLIDAYTAAGVGTASVAILGAGYPDDRVADQLAHHVRARHVVIACDNDKAGRHAAERLHSMLATRAIPTTDICPPAAAGDLNNWARDDPTWSDQLPNIPELQPESPASKPTPDVVVPVPGLRD